MNTISDSCVPEQVKTVRELLWEMNYRLPVALIQLWARVTTAEIERALKGENDAKVYNKLKALRDYLEEMEVKGFDLGKKIMEDELRCCIPFDVEPFTQGGNYVH